MRVDRWIRALLPREDKFLSLFVQDVANLTRASRALCELLDATTEADRSRLVKEVESLEHRGDELTHQIFTELGTTFITPYDREDIAGLASSLDNIADSIDQAATCIHLYQIMEFDDSIRDLADIVERSIGELNRAIPLLRDLRHSDQIRESCVRVNAYENQADGIFHRALARLFQDEKDPIQLIKRRELVAMLEGATDRCEDAAVLIENVLVKYS
jgi:uncharacterized protein